VLRQFVLPIPVTTTRFVRAWEFRPGNSHVVHHATMQIDPTDASRRRDEEDPEPGYEGLVPFSVQSPEGYFIGWTPGQTPSVVPPETAWPVRAESDLVLMLHMRPGARNEIVRGQLGLYFSDVPPSHVPVMLRLNRQDLDIPAGASRYTAEDSYRLPVDVDVVSVQPHAHDLATEVRGYAVLPDGRTEWLIYVKRWNFHWQDVYRYASPVPLPAGTTVFMQFAYDNSSANRANPFNPPRRVHYGQGTSDEMGDLWLQLVPRSASDREALARSLRTKWVADAVAGYELMSAADPDNVALHDDTALLYVQTGNLQKAAEHFAESLRVRPASPAAHLNLGLVLATRGQHDLAAAHYERALALDPNYARAHLNLGILRQAQGKLAEAARHYREAARLAPGDPEARDRLASLSRVKHH
jgi:hypothetical protein